MSRGVLVQALCTGLVWCLIYRSPGIGWLAYADAVLCLIMPLLLLFQMQRTRQLRLQLEGWATVLAMPLPVGLAFWFAPRKEGDSWVILQFPKPALFDFLRNLTLPRGRGSTPSLALVDLMKKLDPRLEHAPLEHAVSTLKGMDETFVKTMILVDPSEHQ